MFCDVRYECCQQRLPNQSYLISETQDWFSLNRNCSFEFPQKTQSSAMKDTRVVSDLVNQVSNHLQELLNSY